MRRGGTALRAALAALAGFALALGAALVAATPAHAADFDVYTEADLADAIDYAVANPTDPVTVQVEDDFALTASLPPLTAGSLTINGGGHTISAGSVPAAAFDVSGDALLSIDGATFDFYESGPIVSSAGSSADPANSPTVTISAVVATAGSFDVAFEIADTAFSMSTTTIHDSEVGLAGIFSFGTPTLQNVTVLDSADCGIEVFLTDDAALTADRVTIERAGCQALWINASDAASATITNTFLADNESGIVLFNQGTGTIDVRDSTVSGSSVAEQLAILALTGTVHVTNSTFSGGLDTSYPTVSVMFEDATVVIEHSTLTGNTVSSAPVLGVSGCGCVGAGSFTLSHTIVAGNTGTSDLAPDVFLDIDPSLSRAIEWSLIGTVDPADTATLDAIAAGAGNLFDATTPIDPDLGALALNGGTTPNHLPNATSPVINAGDPAFVAPPATDQRGSARISGGIIDIGSVEVQFTPSLVLSRTSTAVGDQVTATGTGFPANTTFTMVFNSTPVTLGTATSNASGGLSFAFAVPTSVSAGAHTVTATLAGNVVGSAAITVTGLPDTGSDANPAALAGLLLLLAGAAAIGLRRRRA
ncbi:MAG TPA: right-handed parallel beta-helix repeat-containing protein [Microbacteriaceae bacterium]|nr:right-handed parallel beta-helix repeat-containing protein [Microbacteriaceae bacterium]